MRNIKAFFIPVFAGLIAGCQQTKFYTPSLVPLSAQLDGIRGAAIEVVDLRADRPDADAMQRRVEEQLRAAVPNARPASDTTAPRLVVDVIEQRAYFSLGNWNGATRLRARLLLPGGRSQGPWDASGTSKRANSMGYSTAKRVSQDSYSAAVADLISQLRSVRP